MGKRELLLIVAFVIVGAVVYQATAPAPGPNDKGFSLSRFMDAARREIRGRRASAEKTTTATHAVAADVAELRIVGPISELDITGEARSDVETSFHVRSNGFDDAEAKRLVEASQLITDRAASAIILRADFPRDGSQRGTLKVRVPSRFRIRIEPGSAKFTVSNVSEAEIASTRGAATIRKVSGRVEIVHRGGEVVVEDAGSLDFSGRAGTLKVTTVRGDTSIRLEQGGEVSLSQLSGSVTLESRNAEVTLEDLETTRGPIRVNATGGAVRLKGLKSEARIDARNTEVDVTMSAAAPVSLYTEGEEVSLTPPPAGFRLDAVVVNGRIAPEDTIAKMGLNYSAADDSKESRVSGTSKGGGPTITVRTTRGDLTLRTADEIEKPDTRKKTGAGNK